LRSPGEPRTQTVGACAGQRFVHPNFGVMWSMVGVAIEWRAFRREVMATEPGSLPAAIDLVV